VVLQLRSASSAILTPRALRFIVVGLIGGATDLATFYVTYVRLGAPVILCSASAWSCASAVLFVVGRLWVFPDAQATLPVSSARYIALIVGNGMTTVSVTSLLVGLLGLPYVAVRIFMSALLIPVNYLISKHWVFDARNG